MEKWNQKQVFHFPTASVYLSQNKKPRRLEKGINHSLELCTHAPRTSGTRCAARPKQSLKLQSNFRMADDPLGAGRLADASAFVGTTRKM